MKLVNLPIIIDHLRKKMIKKDSKLSREVFSLMKGLFINLEKLFLCLF